MTQTELNNRHLDWLEAESIHIIREVVAECENPALLFSGGKDSVVLLTLARKAFQLGKRPVHLPFPLVHIDTGHNYPEVIQFRDEQVKKIECPFSGRTRGRFYHQRHSGVTQRDRLP